MSDSTYRKARDALLAGDADGLARLLDAAPDLVHARYDGAEVPYNGYFHRPTLLHHVAGNPEMGPQPGNDRALATLLLARGAEIDALTAAGPDQPTDIGWTVLGLVATSGRPGQLALLDHLVAAGADLEAPGGGPVRGALYYQQRDAARRLVEHGARLDLAAAAGLGRLDVVDALLAPGSDALPEQPRLAHYSQVPLPAEPSSRDLLGVALVHAAMGGHPPVIERLLAAGAELDMRPCFDHAATALHWAVIGDQPATAAWLLAHGADPTLRDATFGSTPRGWAEHCGREALLAVLPPD